MSTEQSSIVLGAGSYGEQKQMPMTYAPVAANSKIFPFLKQVNRFEFFREYSEYWWVGSRTYMLKTIVYALLGLLVATVFPLGSLLFFALAGRSYHKVIIFNFVFNNPGRSLVLPR